jgi:hypothetical protein
MRKLLLIIIVIIIASFGIWLGSKNENKQVQDAVKINNFQECVEAGNPVMESYPRQCRAGEQNFTEDIGNELEKADLIRLDSPRPNQTIKSPLSIKGQARGVWFFEGSFPIVLTNWDGLIIGQGIATAQGEWMTEEFVPFTASIEFKIPEYKNNGTLILRKDNPSGLPEHDDTLETPVLFEENSNNESALSESEALAIAEKSCIKGGESLALGYYNENSKTWWFDANLNMIKEGCNPACAVSEKTKTAEVNWRCTGALPDSI